MKDNNVFEYFNAKPNDLDQIIELYRSVGWTRYTESPTKLMEAIQNSSYVVSAYKDSQLIGLARGFTDKFSVHFIQDLLVHPKYQKLGVGHTLIKKALSLYPNTHKALLLTDNEEYQRLFYESLGFLNLNSIRPKLNTFVKLD